MCALQTASTPQSLEGRSQLVLRERARPSSKAGSHHAVHSKVAAGRAAGGQTGHSGLPRKESAKFALGTVRRQALADRGDVYSRYIKHCGDTAASSKHKRNEHSQHVHTCWHLQGLGGAPPETNRVTPETALSSPRRLLSSYF